MPVCVFGCKWAKTEKIKHAFIHIFDCWRTGFQLYMIDADICVYVIDCVYDCV